MCTLICDTRERGVTVHSDVFEEIPHHIRQITVGDYAVLTPEGNIVAVIERKSLEDYAASLKDGRHENREKMLELREKTKCSVIYIIEGPPFPGPKTAFARMPYSHIESSIFHIMVRDNITIMRTRDELDTARTLVRFIQSMDSLWKQDPESMRRYADQVEIHGGDAIDMLVQPREKTDATIVALLWKAFPGISVKSAPRYMKWSIKEIILGTADLAGVKITRSVAAALAAPPMRVQEDILTAIPGISRASACGLLRNTSLRDLLSLEPAALSEVLIGEKKLGKARANKIIHFTGWKLEPEVIANVD